jgi:hypothetical protein
MTRTCLVIAAVFVLVSTWSFGVATANPHPHQRTGFFIGLGLGWGNAGADLVGSTSTDREDSGSGNFRLGWAVTPSVTLGLENSSWVKTYAVAGASPATDLTLTTTASTFAVTVFPQNMGLYMRGGIGVASASVEIEPDGGPTLSDTEYGLGVLAAAGYEWRLTQKFALGPQLQWVFMNIDDEVTESIDFFSATVQATWYW